MEDELPDDQRSDYQARRMGFVFQMLKANSTGVQGE